MSDFETIRRQCLQAGRLFEDETFPAENSSIYYDKEDPGIVWERPGPETFCPDPSFLIEGGSKHDLSQGNLGNCWFLSAAALLATRTHLFQKVVPADQGFQEQYAGVFHFRLWQFGEWIDVVVDDRLPTKNGRLIFCHNRTHANELWSALMEKAYAKLHGSYQALETGYSHDALVDFTGGIGEFVDLQTVDDSADLFKMMKRLVQANSLMCSAMAVKAGGSYETRLENGLVTGHAYSITGVCEIHTDQQTEPSQVVRLRNPWGYKEWNGPWSDGSAEWDDVTQERRLELGLTVDDEGEFWMPFTDWMSNFDTFQACHLTPDSVHGGAGVSEWKVSAFDGEWVRGATAGGCSTNTNTYWTNPQYYVKVRDPDARDADDTCTLVVSLIQKYTRARKTTEKKEETEEAIAFDLYRYRGDAPRELTGLHATDAALRVQFKMVQFEYLRERSHRFTLTPGVYCIVPVTYEPDTEGEFLLRIASQTPVESGEVDTPSGSHSVKPEKIRTFDRMIKKHAGEDEVVDWKELRTILNEGLKRGKDEEFSKETCRTLVQSLSGDRRGTLSSPDTKQVWKKVKQFQGVFDEHDKDNSGGLDVKELKQALTNMGYHMSKKALARVVRRYCGKGDTLSLDDFIACAVKIETTQNEFEEASRRGGADASGAKGKVEMSLDELIGVAL